MTAPRPLRWSPDGPAVVVLDQTRLPATVEHVVCADVATLVDAIRRLAVRGAPLLGIAGAYGVALAAARGDDVDAAAAALAGARPTAVNLAWAVDQALAAYRSGGAAAALATAREIERADAAAADAIARAGLALVPPAARVLTHCNTGGLVSGGCGTAWGIVLAAHRSGRLAHLWVDETRPLLQGARLTAYEAGAEGIPYHVLADNAAASLLGAGQVDLVVVGADRIAADGSVANKVGTYALAVLARHHGVPFVVAAPCSTIDPRTPDGGAIEIEQRAAEEVTSVAGVPIAPPGAPAYNPAFDVTPPELVSAIVTEAGVVRPVDAEMIAKILVKSAEGVTIGA
jgi:methylthioribose-1-phosphate isomerase